MKDNLGSLVNKKNFTFIKQRAKLSPKVFSDYQFSFLFHFITHLKQDRVGDGESSRPVSTVVQQIKPWLATPPVTPSRMLLRVIAAPLLNLIPANSLYAAQDGPSS